MNYEISDREMRDLHRNSMIIYKQISAIVSGYETQSPAWDTRREIDNKNEPHRHIYASFGDKSIKIHLSRSNKYTLEVYGFIPKFSKPYDAKHGRYRNYFGSFDTLNDCVIAFSKEVYQLAIDYSGTLF